MTREEFIKLLDEKGYSYKEEGDKIVVTHNWNIFLGSLLSIPSGVEFRNNGNVFLGSLTSLPPDVEFRNEEHIYLESLTKIPPGVKFENSRDIYLDSLVGGWFEWWRGNIKGIDRKRLLNKMISDGLFNRK